MYTLVADLETGDRSHAAAQPPTEEADDNDSDESSSPCQLGNADSNVTRVPRPTMPLYIPEAFPTSFHRSRVDHHSAGIRGHELSVLESRQHARESTYPRKLKLSQPSTRIGETCANNYL